MGVKLDGIDPKKEWGLIFLRDHYHPATPEMRNRTMSIPGMPGEWDFGSELGSRPFSLPFGLIDHDKYERQRKLRAFTDFLLDSYGKPREIELTFDYELDKYYLVKVNGRVDVDRLVHAGRFDVPLIAHKPVALSTVTTDEPIIMDSDVWVMADLSIEAEYTFDINGEQTITIINDGNQRVKPIIILEGSSGALGIQNLRFGSASPTISLETFTSKTIEINNEKYTVKVNGVSSLELSNGVFIDLEVGRNDIKLMGTNLDFQITFKFHHQYM